jgi:hypothetical protein
MLLLAFERGSFVTLYIGPHLIDKWLSRFGGIIGAENLLHLVVGKDLPKAGEGDRSGRLHVCSVMGCAIPSSDEKRNLVSTDHPQDLDGRTRELIHISSTWLCPPLFCGVFLLCFYWYARFIDDKHGLMNVHTLFF